MKNDSYNKKKRYFLLSQMLTMALLICACSVSEPVSPAVSEPASGARAETAQDQSEAERGAKAAAEHDAEETMSAETAAGEMEMTKADIAKAWDMKPYADGDLPLSPDLNRNGIAEMVRRKEIDGGQQIKIWENGTVVDTETGYYAYAGQTSVFLCTLDGEDYLLRYHPTMYQGVGSYSYSLSIFTDNREKVDRWNEVDFDINFGSPVHTGFDPGAIAAFMDEINDLLSHSVQLINTESKLRNTFKKEERLYDSLWWLDDREPDFFRDENKSLRENLEDFQTAMTALQEPAVSEEMDGLPITEPLQMRFYSGAGGWQTYLELNPDGSFAGDYQDANVDMVTMCQFRGRFGKVEKLTDASWRLTLAELELTTGRNVGEEWDEENEYGPLHCVAAEPYGFDGADWKALKPGAQFILYSPDAAGNEPGTELYGAAAFQSWMHDRREFTDSEDTLGFWGLQNVETGYGFFSD